MNQSTLEYLYKNKYLGFDPVELLPTCQICYHSRRYVVFNPCGHICCISCASKINRCHMCRGCIKSKIKVIT